MNTRLQVEHPVTELVTGLDLVELQLRIAAGEALPFCQSDLHLDGHAIECRIYAENPGKMFLPAPGRISDYREPANVRVDSGVKANWEVTPHYDPLLAKVAVHAPQREAAILKMTDAVSQFVIGNLTTNLAMHRDILGSAAFTAGDFDTHWLESFVRGN